MQKTLKLSKRTCLGVQLAKSSDGKWQASQLNHSETFKFLDVWFHVCERGLFRHRNLFIVIGAYGVLFSIGRRLS